MIPKEVLRQIKQIEIRTGRLVNDTFAGQYESVFKGRGIEFNEVREYQPGDDIRSIDWNVTARFGHPFIKKFVEERELTIILLVDMSASGNFGTAQKTKSELAAELAAVLSFSAIRNNDKVGLIIFTDQIEKYVPPKKTRTHILRLIREIYLFKPQHRGTSIKKALEYLNEVQKKRAIVFLISDFYDFGYEKLLQIANRRHDVIAVTVTDPKEQKIPAIGLLELRDRETSEKVLVDTRDIKFQNMLPQERQKYEQLRKELFNSTAIDHINIYTNQPYVKPLINFFRIRARRFR